MIADAMTPDEPTDARLADSGLFDTTGPAIFGACERCGKPAPPDRLFCGDACHAAALADMFGTEPDAAHDRPCGCKGGDPVPMDPEAQIRALWAAVGECQVRTIDARDSADLATVVTVAAVGLALGAVLMFVRPSPLRAAIDATARG